MLVTIHQPNYMPWPGFFHKWMTSDAFVILDSVQYHKNDWQNRNRIKTAQGAHWLTVPVHYRFPQCINEVMVADTPWARKHCASVEQAYAQAPYFDAYWPEIASLLRQGWKNLAEMNMALIRLLGGFVDCRAPLHVASEMDVQEEDSSMRLVRLTKALGGDAYLSGQEGKHYLDTACFPAHGVELWFQRVEPPVYPQLHGEFIPYLSVLDLLFNVGPEAARVIRDMGGVNR